MRASNAWRIERVYEPARDLDKRIATSVARLLRPGGGTQKDGPRAGGIAAGRIEQEVVRDDAATASH